MPVFFACLPFEVLAIDGSGRGHTLLDPRPHIDPECLPAGRPKTPATIAYPARMQQETRVARWSAPRSRHGTPLF
ncbi:hypothetical protein CBM2606_A90372 [Cupriavidus taiwanensis]|nr:hypothetical protein CBM2606_A90372 [Cupriavidus taiwanensis]